MRTEARYALHALLIAAAAGATAGRAEAQCHQRRGKRMTPVVRPASPGRVSQDFGNIAVLVDNGLMATPRNVFDLNGRVVRFAPAGQNLYAVSSSAGPLDPVYGTALAFGYPGATQFPGDDDTEEVAFPAGFPFFGATYASVWVNTDGNVTFGAPEFASDDRDKAKHVLGPPRISAYLIDVNAFNTLNPAGSGSIHAAVQTGPDRLVITWNDVADFQGGVSSTFQLRLYGTGVIEIAIDHIDPAAMNGVTGIAQGNGAGPINLADFASLASPQAIPGGVIAEAFATYTQMNVIQTAREFYRSHPDKFDFLSVHTSFPVDGALYSNAVSSQTHGIGAWLNPASGQPIFDSTTYDSTAGYGSAGELEQVLFMSNTAELAWPLDLVNPPIEPFREDLNLIQVGPTQGWPITFDGQAMSQARRGGTLLPDNGEFSRNFPRPTGLFYLWLISGMSAMTHEIEHRWGVSLKFVHPTKGADGLDAYDLLGRDAAHWSYFVNAALPPAQFGGVPRCPGMEGNAIVDLGTPATWNGFPTNLAPGERVFQTPPDQLMEGCGELDQYLMGLRRASEVAPFWYVDEPVSIRTGQSLDVFNPTNPLSSSDSMRVWLPQGGIAFKGRRVDLTIQSIKDYEKLRERSENPKGNRFWGPKGNLRVRYFRDTRQVDPAGDASVTLSEADRELGDEADRIGPDGKPVDVKTVAFILVVPSGDPGSHNAAIGRLDEFRRTWEAYINGPGTAGRGRFDTRLDPPVW